MLYLKNFADLNTYEVLFIQNAAVPLKVMAGGQAPGLMTESVPLLKVFCFRKKLPKI